MGLGWHEPMRESPPPTFRNERVSCGKTACGTCGGNRPAHGPYWYAYWQTGGRKHPQMHKRYIGRASATATPDELRRLFEQRQEMRRRRRTAENATGRGPDPSTSRRTAGSSSSSRTDAGSGASAGSASGSRTSGASAGAGARRAAGDAGGSRRAHDPRSNGSNHDPYARRRPPPIEQDFDTVGAAPGATWEQVRAAYKTAARKNHPDRGGDVEKMKRINAAWERLKHHFGKT